MLQDVDVAEELVKRGYAQWVKEDDGAKQNGEPITSKVRFYYFTSGILLVEMLCLCVWCVVCGVWCVVCGVLCVVCGVCGVCGMCACMVIAASAASLYG